MPESEIPFSLDPRLEADTLTVADGPLSRILLMNDARFPWLILVPRVAGASELFDLGADQQAQATEEIAKTATVLKQLTGAMKINVGALGNIVPQLHIHIVARHASDAAWPGPVWGAGTAVRYSADAGDAFLLQLRHALGFH